MGITLTFFLIWMYHGANKHWPPPKLYDCHRGWGAASLSTTNLASRPCSSGPAVRNRTQLVYTRAHVQWCFSAVSQEQIQSSTQIIKARCVVQSTTPRTEPSESCLRGDIIEPRTIPQGSRVADWYALCVRLRSFPPLTRGKREEKNIYWANRAAYRCSWSMKQKNCEKVSKDKTQGQKVETTEMMGKQGWKLHYTHFCHLMNIKFWRTAFI